MPNNQEHRSHIIKLANELAAELGEPTIDNEEQMQEEINAQAADTGPVPEETPPIDSWCMELAELDDAASAAVDIATNTAEPDEEEKTFAPESASEEIAPNDVVTEQAPTFPDYLMLVLKTPEEEAASFLRFTSGHFTSLLRGASSPEPTEPEPEPDITDEELSEVDEPPPVADEPLPVANEPSPVADEELSEVDDM
jgi:hypothetical protein